ncbi:MAG: PaaX family transcriptional regulator C-terminal domain-containing protein, partial [Anaerolineales bacterium]
RRIYDNPTSDWDGTWHLVAYSFSNGQERIRHRLRKELSWLGFGQLNNGTLISPHDHISEVRELVAALGATSSVDYFRADYKELYGANNLAMRCWSLDEINDYYCEFIEKYRPMYQRDLLAVDSRPPAYCFERRFWLTHQYRYFPFHDPYLPAQLLPDNWRGGEAVQLFRDYHSLLRNNAEAYVDQVLAGAPSKTGAI